MLRDEEQILPSLRLNGGWVQVNIGQTNLDRDS
ncbi:hypothetical protein SNOG_01354 [Parastagonospora nodorum SN15]|uniref:Uncharacterized protein n=1 Tax=Phaeosphaeria nodorum (strain SN15 / ATCC MYA-4574 / FGSC 10173) TaxID=321614 RepID=Q0V3R0_PHANO|nr:hypothetical protein SNOG_01354 [Parastagonospora nodorum SN15]EAT91003.1 hypothetical protein SNOG_01354 [Parastagonospora nodorum SN15]